MVFMVGVTKKYLHQRSNEYFPSLSSTFAFFSFVRSAFIFVYLFIQRCPRQRAISRVVATPGDSAGPVGTRPHPSMAEEPHQVLGTVCQLAIVSTSPFLFLSSSFLSVSWSANGTSQNKFLKIPKF